MHRKSIGRAAPWLLGMLLVITACKSNLPSPAPTHLPSPRVTSSATVTPTSLPSSTPIPPTSTPVPLAARVNGEDLTLEEFQAELTRYKAAQQASGQSPVQDDGKLVLDDLIDEMLLAQAAHATGFKVDDAMLQDRLDQLIVKAGGEQAFDQWLADNDYTLVTFRHALSRSIASAWMRDQIVAQVPDTADQVHARQILLYNVGQANQVLTQLDSGKDFASLAASYDPTTQGDLGWFPKGYLTDPKLDEAAFNLQPGEHSPVIETSHGFVILQVIERDPEHVLEPDARLVLQMQALQNWLEAHRSQSEITIETTIGSVN
jgi:peptidyl-prolyl cis-trans isomerase C